MTAFLILFPGIAGAVNIPDFGFADMFYEMVSSEFTTWGIIETVGRLYMTKIGSFVFWAVLFAICFIALYTTTGGLFIPSVVFSAVGFILINVMPSELDAAAKILLAVGLFAVPIYQYISR